MTNDDTFLGLMMKSEKQQRPRGITDYWTSHGGRARAHVPRPPSTRAHRTPHVPIARLRAPRARGARAVPPAAAASAAAALLCCLALLRTVGAAPATELPPSATTTVAPTHAAGKDGKPPLQEYEENAGRDNTIGFVAGAVLAGALLLAAALGALACAARRRPSCVRRVRRGRSPMLSVQAPGCAGMERLGAPGGPAPPPDRPRLRREALDHRHRDELVREQQQQLEALQREVGRLLEQQARVRSATAADLLGLPPPIQLPDGEHGADAHLQLRVAYQQAELTRSCVQPPPNKSVSDVPEWASGGGLPTRRTAPGKKDGFVQKAVRYLRGATGGGRAPSALVQQLGADEAAAHRLQRDLETLRRPPAPPPANAPCVMVPLPPPSPPSTQVPPSAPSPTGDV